MSNTLRKQDNATSGTYGSDFVVVSPQQDSPAMFNENVLPKEKIALLNALDYLANLDDDWNGYSAVAPTQRAIDMARHFITLLPLNKTHARKIEPDGEGGIILTWQNNHERILLTIDGSMMHLSHEQNEQDTVYINDVPFFNEEDRILSHKIIDHIPRA